MSNTRDPDDSWGIGQADGLLLFTAILWGVNFSVVKFALSEIPPTAFMGLRFLVASGTMMVLTVVAGRGLRFKRHHLPNVIGLGLLGTSAYQLLFIFGISLTTAENSALILATSPAWVALIGTLAKSERIKRPGWFGIALSVAGVVFIIWGSDRMAQFPFGGSSLGGDLLILCGTVCWSLYTLMVRPMTKHYSSISVTSFSTLAGTVPLVLIGLPTIVQLEWTSIHLNAWLALVFSGIFAIGIAYFFWNYGVSRLGSTRTSIYSNLSLPAALITAWFWLTERLTPLQLAGAGMALGGVILARRFAYPVKSDTARVGSSPAAPGTSKSPKSFTEGAGR